MAIIRCKATVVGNSPNNSPGGMTKITFKKNVQDTHTGDNLFTVSLDPTIALQFPLNTAVTLYYVTTAGEVTTLETAAAPTHKFTNRD
jgi:hypothetical protein